MSASAGWPRRLALVGDEAVEVPPGQGVAGMHEPLAALPEGVYSGLRTFPGARFLALEAHLDRAERSARALGSSLADERPAIRRTLQRLADEAAPRDLALRFDVLPEPFGLEGVRSRVWFAAAPLQPVPEHLLVEGVGVGVARDLSRPAPRVKTTSFVLRRKPYPLAQPELYEHLMLDARGCVLEGTSSNFFAVRSGRILTAGEGVLEGITRAIVLELAARLSIPVALEPPPLDGSERWDEAFLTSSTRAVVPVVRVEGTRVGAGRPGELTRRLMAAYHEHATREARRVDDGPTPGPPG